MKQTPGPWYMDRGELVAYGGRGVALMASRNPEHEANAARIVNCVNPLEGIEDPAAFVEQAKLDRMTNQQALMLLKATNEKAQALAEAARTVDESVYDLGEENPRVSIDRESWILIRAALERFPKED